MLNIQYPRIMRDDQLEEQLKRDGYLVIKQFLTPGAVKDLWDYNAANQPGFKADHIINSVWHSVDNDYKMRTIDKIGDVYKPFCDEYFVDYKIFGGSFVIKPGGGKAASAPHIDFGIVDEDKYRSFNLWIPLVKLTKENGPLQVMKGSHRIRKTFRGPNIPDSTSEAADFFWEKADELLLNPGDAVLYDHQAVHCSRNNDSDKERIATSCAMTSKDAGMVIYFLNEEKQKIQAYPIDTEYLMKNNHANPPTHVQPSAEWDYKPVQFSPADFGMEFKKKEAPQQETPKAQPQPSFFKKLVSLVMD